MTVCRDLTKQPVEPAKKPIELLYFLGLKGSDPVAEAKHWKYLDRLFNINGGRSIISAYDSKDCPEEQRCVCVGYWNDGVVE